MSNQGLMPYPSQDGNTAGFAGEGGSADRAHHEARTGKSAGRQRITLQNLRHIRATGLTWRELAAVEGWHHGQASGVLSVLHKEGRIACLHARRDNCSIYVLPQYVEGRPTVEHRGTQAARDRASLQRIRDLVDLASPDGSISVRVLRAALDNA